MNVLVIKPIKVCSVEEMQKLKDIKPSEGGVVVLPSYCEYEFGEIDRLQVIVDTSINDNAVHDAYMRGQQEGYQRGCADSSNNGFTDEYMKGIADFMKFEEFFYSGNAFEAFADVKNEDGSLNIGTIMRRLSMEEIMKRIEKYSNQGE